MFILLHRCQASSSVAGSEAGGVAGSEGEPEAESEEPEAKPVVVRDEMDDLNDLVAGLDEDHVSGT
jgi:hypothetical protein